MIRKLRTKFVIINMTIVVLMLIAILGIVFFTTKNRLETQNVDMMRDLATNPMKKGRPDDTSGDIRLPFFTLQTDTDGNITAGGGGYFDLSDEEFLQELMVTVSESGAESGILEEYNLRYLKVHDPGAHSDVYVFTDISGTRDAVSGLFRVCVAVFVLAFIIFLGISILLARWAVRPVEKAWAAQKQFVADASHELKTPLTVIMTGADMLSSGEFTQEQNVKFITNIQTMAAQMKGLVDEMLQLTRLEASQNSQVLSELDFSALVTEQVSFFEPIYYERGLELETHIEDGIKVKGADSALRQAVEVILDNAQKYCYDNTRITVSLSRIGSRCQMKVSDFGDEIPAKELKLIFERFYRADKARSMNHSYGLGLAIAKQAVEKCRGSIRAESKDGINSFIIQLPVIQ